MPMIPWGRNSVRFACPKFPGSFPELLCRHDSKMGPAGQSGRGVAGGDKFRIWRPAVGRLLKWPT